MSARKSIPQVYDEITSEKAFKENRKNLVLFKARMFDQYLLFGQHAIEVCYLADMNGEFIQSIGDYGFIQFQYIFDKEELHHNIRTLVSNGYKLRYVDITPDYILNAK